MDRPGLGAGPAPIGRALRDQAGRFRILEEEQQRFRPMIYWYLTFTCNLACSHCSVSSSPWVDSSADLATAECLRVIEQMAELQVSAVLLSGGEFLIRPDALQILRSLAGREIAVGLESNGILYPPGFFELAGEMQAKGLLTITISLDGGTRETHERLRGPRSFERTLAGLRRLQENGIRFNLQCVLNHESYHTIPDLYALAAELSPACGAVQWAFLNPVGRGTGLIEELGIRSGDIPALFRLIGAAEPGFAGRTVVKLPPAMVPPRYLPMILKSPRIEPVTTCQFPLLGILPNGDVTICAVSRDNQDLCFGNVRDEGFRLRQVWEKTRMGLLRSRYLEAANLSGICGDCVWKYQCKGACRAWAFEEGGSFDAPFPLCQALAEAGDFPKVYRLSHQNAAAIAGFQRMSIECGCTE